MSQKSTTTMVPGSYAWKIRSLDGLPLVGLNDLLHQAVNESRYPLEHVRAEIIGRLALNLPQAYCMDRDGIPRPIEGDGFGFITEAERQQWIQHDLEEALQHGLPQPKDSEYANRVSEPGWPALLRLLKSYWGKGLPSRPFIDLNRLSMFRSDDEQYEMADRILISQADADRFFFEWLNPVEVDSSRDAENCSAARFEYASPYKGVALTSWPIGQHRLICLAQILDQVNGAGLMPSKANKKAIIQVLERHSPPCFYLGGSDGAESCDAFLFGWTSIEDAQGSVAQQRNDADWLKKDRMARQRDMPSGESVRQREARARTQAGIDFMSYASAPGWPAILKRLKFDWLGEGVEVGFSAESVEYVAIKLTDADRLLGHLLPAAAPEQVMPLAPEPVTTQTDSKPAGASGLPENVHAALVKLAAEIGRLGPTHEQMRLVYRLGIEVDGKPKSGSRGRGRFNALASEILGRTPQMVGQWRAKGEDLSASPIGAMLAQLTPSAARSSASTPKRRRA